MTETGPDQAQTLQVHRPATPETAAEPSWVEQENEDTLGAPAGRLTPAGRRAALAGALPLVGTYFERGTRPLVVQTGPSRGQDATETDRLLAALRLRLALAATDTLAQLAADISQRPNFRYERRREDTVGVVRGRLDVTRYLTGVQHLQQPPRYPVIAAARTQATPENTLLVCAAHWLMRELAQPALLAVLPNPGPERQAARAANAKIRALLVLPLLATCRPAARDVMRRGELSRLLSKVRQRISTGQVRDAQPYRDLVKWVGDCLSGHPAAEAGALDWSFYGDAFDSKLFELWCLHRLAATIGAALGQPPAVPDLMRRLNEPLYKWNTPLGELSIHFQRSPSTYEPRRLGAWRRTSDGRALRGIPDISVVGTPDHGDAQLVLLDPKLRQRQSAPADELYKLLGYFEQYGLHGKGTGAVILYGADDRVLKHSTTENGRLLAITVNPASDDGEVARAWVALCSLALSSIHLEPLAEQSPGGGATRQLEVGSEATVEQAQQRAVLVLASLAQQVGDAALRPWRSQLETAFPGTWDQLSSETKEMCATAVYLGNVLTDGRDFSGPVLGLAAAAEKLLWDHVFEPAAQLESTVAEHNMLGQMLETLRLAVAGHASARSDAVRTTLQHRGVDLSAAAKIVVDLIAVNRNYRRAAAHRDLLTRSSWMGCYRLMVVGADPLLPRLVSLLLGSGTGPSGPSAAPATQGQSQ